MHLYRYHTKRGGPLLLVSTPLLHFRSPRFRHREVGEPLHHPRSRRFRHKEEGLLFLLCSPRFRHREVGEPLHCPRSPQFRRKKEGNPSTTLVHPDLNARRRDDSSASIHLNFDIPPHSPLARTRDRGVYHPSICRVTATRPLMPTSPPSAHPPSRSATPTTFVANTANANTKVTRTTAHAHAHTSQDEPSSTSASIRREDSTHIPCHVDKDF
jgi:hypothetical protein